MFGRKKQPVLTATSCAEMELLRLAVEVLTAKRVCFKQFDFNTGRGQLQIGEEVKKIVCVFKNSRILEVLLMGIDEFVGDRYLASLEYSGIIKINKMYTGRTYYYGRSMVDRWEEPIVPENFVEA